MLMKLYKRLDEELASFQPGCEACGRCCDFPAAGHRLFASSMEVDYLLDNAAPPGDFDFDSGHCPFWKDMKCLAHEFRMLGCRTFHHDGRTRERANAVCEKYLAELKAMTSESGGKWQYGDALDLMRKAAGHG